MICSKPIVSFGNVEEAMKPEEEKISERLQKIEDQAEQILSQKKSEVVYGEWLTVLYRE